MLTFSVHCGAPCGHVSKLTFDVLRLPDETFFIDGGVDQAVPGDVIKGKYDSILDIIMDTAGALIAAGLVLFLLVDSYEPPPPARMPASYLEVR